MIHLVRILSAALALIPLCAIPKEAAQKPVKVYILAGQSNMVGIGQVDSGGTRWGAEFQAAELSLYPGAFDPKADYDALTPTQKLKLAQFGGTTPTPFPAGGTAVVRGVIQHKVTGIYEMRPGYGDSSHCIMSVAGKEVYRKEVDQEPVHTPVKLTAGEKISFRIVYLTAGANGLGWISRRDVPGTLTTLVKEQGEFPFLLNAQGGWASRDDVWYKGVVTATANKWLSVGCGAAENSIGPELGFGHVIGNFHDEPVLLLKASQGNRSLGWDFLPPGSVRYTHEGKTYAGYKDTPDWWIEGQPKKAVNWYAGKQYDDCFGEAQKVLGNFDQNFPHWKSRGFEIAGFVWWQGHKDGGEPHASRYEANLVRLIKSLRQDFHAPNAPFVLATIGFNGWEMTGPHKTVAEAQLAVSGEKGKYPEFKGNVRSVETRGFWPKVEESPRNQDFHYHGNARTFMQVGEALGQAMVGLLKGE